MNLKVWRNHRNDIARVASRDLGSVVQSRIWLRAEGAVNSLIFSDGGSRKDGEGHCDLLLRISNSDFHLFNGSAFILLFSCPLTPFRSSLASLQSYLSLSLLVLHS